MARSSTCLGEEPDPDDRENLVTVNLSEQAGATRVDVAHGPFATDGRRALHRAGWTDALDRLEELLSS